MGKGSDFLGGLGVVSIHRRFNKVLGFMISPLEVSVRYYRAIIMMPTDQTSFSSNVTKN